jgi:hypothetical protein
MKELRRIKKELHKTLNNMHTVTLKDRTYGVVIDWDVRIVVVSVESGKVITTIDDIVKVIRKPERREK